MMGNSVSGIILGVILLVTGDLSAQAIDQDRLMQELEAVPKFPAINIRQEGTEVQRYYRDGAERIDESEFIYECDVDGMIKSWTNYLKSTENGSTVQDHGEFLYLVSPDYMIYYYPESSSANISKGKSDYLDNWNADVGFFRDSVLELKDDIVLIEKTVIDEEPVIRIVTSQMEDGMQDKVQIINLMPEKGYRLRSKYVFLKGRLTNALRYEEYIEIAEGFWLPKIRQAFWVKEPEDNLAIQSIYENKDWSVLNDFDLSTIDEKKMSFRNVSFDTLEYFPDGYPSDLDFQITSGTQLYDERRLTNKNIIVRHDIMATQLVAETKLYSPRWFLAWLRQGKELLILTFILICFMAVLARYTKVSPIENTES